MPFTNDTELVAQVKAILHREDDISDDQVYDWIRLTEVAVARKLDLRDQEVTSTVTLTSGDPAYTLPSAWRTIRSVAIAQQGQFKNLRPVSAQNAETQKLWTADAGDPTYFYIQGQSLHVIPTVKSDTTAKIMHDDGSIDLRTDTTNWLLEQAPDVYLYGALIHSAVFIGEDERMTVWNALFASALESTEGILWDWKFMANGGQARPDISVPSGKILQRQTR